MKKLSKLLELPSDDKLFEYIQYSFRDKITTWDYFVNWKKVFDKVKPIEKELNLLNYLIGKENIEHETALLIKQYPGVIKAIPYLIACREKSFDVLIDIKQFISKRFDFSLKTPTDDQINDLASFVLQAGLADILRNKQVKNLVDYAIGVEVGLDSNGRKNRGGTMMEGIVEVFVDEYCQQSGAEYLTQATAAKIKAKWGIQIEVDKSSRIIDFAINKNGKLYLVEVNFYSGPGSKLKSTATEYCEMYNRYHRQGIEFIWVTDGAGWQTTLKPLREYFDISDYLVNLEMLRNGVLEKII
ncbi:MAG: type II restriction endonuclease [Paludibacter sp.]|nr:type II restriction endonuclease [Paludibacter sp.]